MECLFRVSLVFLCTGIALAGCNKNSSEPNKESPHGATSSTDSRNAGTILEYLEEAKCDKAKLDAVMIEQTIKVWFIKNDSTFPDSLDALVKPPKSKFYLERGPDALLDPWGKKYQFKIGEDAEKQPTVEIWTIAPDGTRIDNARKK